MARPDLTAALDALFAGAADLRVAAADIRPVTPTEHRQQLALLALAARIRTDVARIGNEHHETAKGVSSTDTPGTLNLSPTQVSPSALPEAA